jgi:hypothetical protein
MGQSNGEAINQIGSGTSVLNQKFGGLQIDSMIADSPDFGEIGDGSTLCSFGIG